MTTPMENSIDSQSLIASSSHVYDGIQKLDNPIPKWWKTIFIATILFGPTYWMVFQLGGPGSTLEEKYELEKSLNTKKKYGKIGDLKFTEETMVEYLQKPEWVAVGGSIFKANCASCHLADGGGNVGPNLCDDAYKHVKTLPDIIKVVNDGVGSGAMPAWGKRLSHPNDVVLVSVYVASLRGTKPAKGKAPDGSPIPPWPVSK